MKRFFIIFLLCILISQINAQVAGRITQIINTDQVTYGQISYISAVATGLAQETDSYEKCFEILQSENIITGNHALKDPVSVKHFANIICKAWDVNNSVMYRFFKTPRYALKQLKAAGVIPDSYYPERILTGSEAMNIFTTCLETYGTTGTE